MKILMMCEGSNELEIMEILLKNNCLKYSRVDLLGLRPYHARQIEKSSIVKTELNLYLGEIKVFRIGDSLNEQLKIPKDYKGRIISVEKYCTKPELEMLLIIAEGMIDAFDKVKSSVKAKNFAKQNIRCGRKKYDNSSEFYENYFGSNVELLVESIKEYKRIKGKHGKDEGYLADLLKE